MVLLTVLVVLFVAYTRRRETHLKKSPEDDVRENIIRYQDEGGGEEDLNAVDLLPLKVPGQEPDPDTRSMIKGEELTLNTQFLIFINKTVRNALLFILSLNIQLTQAVQSYHLYIYIFRIHCFLRLVSVLTKLLVTKTLLVICYIIIIFYIYYNICNTLY